MSIGVVSRKMLWGRAGNSCAYPNCRELLIQSADELTGEVLAGEGILIGEEAHIRSAKSDGPRHQETYDQSKLDVYANLILLCPTHHTLIDKDGGAAWPVEKLEQLKRDHEGWVHERVSPDDQRALETDVLIAAEVQRLEGLLFNRWSDLYWQLGQGIPGISRIHLEALVEAGVFLLAKDWPPAYSHIGMASERARQLVALLVQHISENFDGEDNYLRLARPEKRIGWDPPLYAELGRATEINMVVTWWLTEMLTLALNYWIRAVRTDLDPLYRFSQGVVLAAEGDGIVYDLRYVRMEHDPDKALPDLPQSLDQLRAAVDEAATKKGERPQHLLTAEVDLSAVGGTGHPLNG